MSDLPKFVMAADGAEARPLETDLYSADPQGLEADNIAASGNLNIGMIVDYDARSEHRAGGGAKPSNAYHPDDGSANTPGSSGANGNAPQTYYGSTPTTDAEQTPQPYHAANHADRAAAAPQNNSPSSPPAAADDAAAHRSTSFSDSSSATHDSTAPTIIHDGSGNTEIITTNTWNITNNTTNISNTYNFDDHSVHNSTVDISIDIHGHGHHGGDTPVPCEPPCEILPVIVDNVFNTVNNAVNTVNTTMNTTISDVHGEANTLLNVVNSITNNTSSEIGGALSSIVTNTVNDVSSVATSTVNNITTAVNTVLNHDGAGGLCLPVLPDTAGALCTVDSVVGSVLDGALVTAGGLLNGVGDTLHGLPSTLENLPGTLVGAVNYASGALPVSLPEIMGTVGSAPHTLLADAGAVVCDPAIALYAVNGIAEGAAGALGGLAVPVIDASSAIAAPLIGTAEGVASGIIADPAHAIGLLDAGAGILNGMAGSLPMPAPEVVLAAENTLGGTYNDAHGLIANPGNAQGEVVGIVNPVLNAVDDGASHVYGAATTLLSNPADTLNVLSHGAAVVNDAAGSLPIPVPETVATAENISGSAYGDATALLANPGNAQGVAVGIVNPVLNAVDDSVGHSIISNPGNLQGDVVGIVNPLLSTADDSASHAVSSISVGTLPSLSPLPLSSEGLGGGSDGAPLPGAIVSVADGATGGGLAPIPDIALPAINNATAILHAAPSDLAHSATSLVASGDAHGDALTLLAMADHAHAALAVTASDAGHLLAGADIHANAASHAEAAAALPAPVIAQTVSHPLTSLFHH